MILKCRVSSTTDKSKAGENLKAGRPNNKRFDDARPPTMGALRSMRRSTMEYEEEEEEEDSTPLTQARSCQ